MSEPLRWDELQLFDPGPESIMEARTKAVEKPVWSEHKADLIARYLRYFVFVTRHGTYIDAFAGPQTDRSSMAWTAELVVSSEPKWLRHFHLFDNDPAQVERLQRLRELHADRDVTVYPPGDSNRQLPAVLPAGSIGEREASFCLLDQRTFECEWQLCRHVALLRPGQTKVEQFYFLANSWLPRALSAVSTAATEDKVQRWLGDEDWRYFAQLSPLERVQTFIEKFKGALSYRFVRAWPIYGRTGGRGVVMYYMIHATDHREAAKLMYRAYNKAVDPPEPSEQLELLLDGVMLD